MLGAIVAMAVVLDSRVSPDPASLVAQLGSSRYAARISAEGELARLGREALPALRAAKASKDLEIRARSVALLARIEHASLLQPTPVGLDFADVPLTDAVEAINRRAGLGLALSPEERPLLEGRRISLRADEPLPFWKAIDALCSAGKVHSVQEDRASQGGLEGTFPLRDGVVAGLGPVSDSGPFRVQLLSIHRRSEILLDDGARVARADPSQEGARPVAQANREFFLNFFVAGEPRLSITRNGPTRLTTAVDDRGQSLWDPAAPGSFQHTAGYFGMNPSSTQRFRVDLNYPDSQSRRIQTLRGVVPVLVAMRKPDPLVVPLAGSKGRTFRGDDVTLTLLDHRPAANNQPSTIQVAIKPLGLPPEPMNVGEGEPSGLRPESPQQQIEVVDAEGKVLSWFCTAISYDGEEKRITLTVANRGNPGGPATLRHYGILKAKADIDFEFRDIPIP